MGLFSDGGPGLCSSGAGRAAPKENYRSIGRGSGGVEVSSKRKFHFHDCDYSTTPSIPGKFETVLYRGNREDSGFGSRAPRFGQEQRYGELPGPGTHNTPAGLTYKGLTESMVGKRGHGPFASRTPQQKSERSSEAPGPGFYCGPGTEPRSARSSSSKPNASFVPPSSMNPAKFNARPSPGPCDYIGASAASKFKVDNTGAVVSHRGERESATLAAKTETPGPGAYHNERHRPASAEPVRRRLAANSLLNPKSEPPAKGVSEAGLLRQATELLAEDAALRSSIPGPGQYEPKLEATSTHGSQVSFSTGETYAFRVGNSHCPRKWRPGNPGPCEYEVPPDSPRGNAAASAFACKVSRFKEKEKECPGPAYYSPRKTADKDFHLNPQNLWA